MSNFRCWSAAGVARTVFSDIGSLAGDADAIFLAAHTPVQLEHVKGPEISSSSSGEVRVLEALLSQIGDLERNTLVAVTGASGSGKSHVVRWVHSHLPADDPRFHVLYVPRAVQTLRELLRRIIEGLPGVEGNELMNRVDEAISSVRPGELQERLVYEMKIALNWTLEDRAPYEGETPNEAAAREDRNSMLGMKDEKTGGRSDGLADLLDLALVKEALLRPDGRLSLLVNSYYDETSRRDDNEEIFTRDDLPLKVRGVRTALAGRSELAQLWAVIARQPDDAIDLLEEALRTALPKAVGLRSKGSETLDSVFRESRKALRAKGQDLMLIFEDLAQFGLVDGELYDQFVTQPGADLAPLRVVFAVTDGPYGRMERTVRGRVEHEFHVGGSALHEPAQFIGRYLNLVRVGREETESLWDPRRDLRPGSNWMLNACDTREQGQPCRVRDTCHASFGTTEIGGLGEVGLYPYNAPALRRAFAEAEGRAVAEGRPVTPRDVMQLCVETTLPEADAHIAAGDFPHERTRQQFDFKVRMAKDALLTANPSSDPERNYRALVIWGDESPLPAGVLEAFNLDGVSKATRPRPEPVNPRPDSERRDLPNPLLPLFQWQIGDGLPEDDVNVYRSTLHALTVDRLQLDESLVHIHKGRGKVMLDSSFNVTSFDIEGARGRVAGAQSARFALTRTAEDMRVMAAARWFRDHGHFDPSRATWQWPEGYDPAQLLVEMEIRLDAWAHEVRVRFLEWTGGARLARQAVGVRAVALATAGWSAPTLGTSSAVLNPPDGPRPRASDAWAGADQVATGIITSLKVGEYVGEFAAVRQGETGQPQLVDPRDLDDAIEHFLADPTGALEEVAASKADPVLALSAQQLLAALAAGASGAAASAREAFETVTSLLEGHSTTDVSSAAEEVGVLARDAGLFRPPDKWLDFRAATELLSAARTSDVPVITDGDVGTVVRGQRAIRELERIAQALTFVKHVMGETRKESERGTGHAGDVSTLRAQVKSQVDELATLVGSLGSEEK